MADSHCVASSRRYTDDLPLTAGQKGDRQHHRNLGIPDTLADACDAERMAPPVYDMQVGVVDQLPDGPQVTQRVARVLDAARGALVRVFFIRFMTLPPS
jgi:biuret amidohydrolase